MRKKIDIVGQVFGRLTVVKECETHITPSNRKYSKWLCRCECGNTKKIRGASLRNGVTTSCGCYQKEVATKNRTKHGDRYSKEYITWLGIKQRCSNSSNTYYSAKGIKVYPEWINSYETFLSDVGRAPGPEYSIDRIDVNGDYEPENVRWATTTVQNINQGMKKTNTSGHKGVFWNKASKKWQAQIKINYKHIYLGRFFNLEDAIQARKLAEEKYHQPLLVRGY